ncbi:MAG: hypothetical protein LIO51_02545 [Clostridiales bacterium]|nr:hypothetical protein [Clostridiales bacterium]
MLTKEQATKLMKAANRAGWEMKPVSEVKEKALNGALRSYASGVRREDVFAVMELPPIWVEKQVRPMIILMLGLWDSLLH